MALDLTTLTDEELRRLNLQPPTQPATAMPSVGAAPDVHQSAPQGIPSLVSSPNGIPDLTRPTGAQSRAAGKAEYQRELPSVTATPGTPDYDIQKLQLGDFQKAHPLGADISARPGFWGKLEHGVAKAANIAGDVLAPAETAMIPGSDLNRQMQRAGEWRNLNQAVENENKQEQTAASEAGRQLVPWTAPGTSEPVMVPFKSLGAVETAATRGQTQEDIAGKKIASTEGIASDKNKTALLRAGFDEKGVPLPDDQLSPQQLATRQLVQSRAALADAQTEVEKAKNDPNSPAFKLAQARLEAAARDYQLRLQAEQLHANEFANKVQEQGILKPSGQAQSRASAAQSVLDLIPSLTDLVKKNGEQMGPLMGRLNRGEVAIGDVDPDIAELYSAMKSFYALQPAVHGFRNAEFVKDFETALGTLERNPDAFIAGMKGLKPTLQSVAKEGRTFHKRIVEGQENQGGEAAPKAAGGGGGGVKITRDANGRITGIE